METKKEVKKRSPRKKKVEEVSERYSETSESLDQLKAVEIDEDTGIEEEGIQEFGEKDYDPEMDPSEIPPMPEEMEEEQGAPQEGPSFWHRVIRRR